jgi:hypothetical protein
LDLIYSNSKVIVARGVWHCKTFLLQHMAVSRIGTDSSTPTGTSNHHVKTEVLTPQEKVNYSTSQAFLQPYCKSQATEKTHLTNSF